MWNSIKVQINIMKISREFRVAFLISLTYAIFSFAFYAFSLTNIDISLMKNANEYVCFSPYHAFWNFFMLLYPFIAVMPFSTSYVDDYKNKLIVIYASRLSRRKYYISKLVVAYIGSALVIAIPFLINLSLCNIFLPHKLNTWEGMYQMGNYYRELLGLNFLYEPSSYHMPLLGVYLQNKIVYCVIYILGFSFITGFLGMLAMACSFVFRKHKILVYVPIYFVIQLVQNIDLVIFNSALNGKQTYVSINFIDYFIPFNNNGGFSLMVILGEIVLLLLVIMLLTVFAVNDDIRSV